MIDRAESLGVRIAWNTQVQLREQGKVFVAGQPCEYEYLVGADGQSSAVRRWAGLEKGTLVSRRFGFRRHFRVPQWSEYVEVHWGTRGQVYVTPVGSNELCIATIASDPKVRMAEVLESIPLLNEKLAGLEISSANRGAVTTTRRLKRVARGRIALIGDASGSADAITGEGLAMVFRQSQLLANAIERGDLDFYAEGHPAILKMPMTMARVMLTMDRWSSFRDRAIRVLAADPALFSRLLGVHMGEESLPRFVYEKGLSMGLRMLAPVSAGI
jgi:flavin-dependent dehydrogenase